MRSRHPTITRAGAALILLAALTASASAQPLRVVSDAGPAEQAPAGARYARAVTVHREALEVAATGRRAVRLEVQGRTIDAAPDHVASRGAGVSWFGETDDGGRVTLTLHGGYLFGRIVTPQAFIVIEPAAGGHVAYEPGPFPETEPDGLLPPHEGGASSSLIPDVLFPDEMHLMIAYTPATAAVLGATLPAYMQAAEDVINDVFQNSLLPIRARVVHTVPVDYVESGNMSTDLSRLRTTADNIMDEVHALRDAYAADLVALIVQSGNACGVAYIQDPIRVEFAPSGFSVNGRGCAVSNITLPHELGHNFGLRHDRFVDQTNTPFTYSHGFVNDDSLNTPPGTPGVRTTLAYNDQCSSQGGTCTRIPFYSSPNLTFAGHVLGDSILADNARAADFSLPIVAQFRAPILLAEHDGTTTGAPIWQRPDCSNPADITTCVVGESARYAVASVQAAGDGRHHFSADAAHDAVLLLYDGLFDPAMPLRGLVGYAEPDSTQPDIRRVLLSATLDQGASYTLVTTGFTLADAGDFDIGIYGPAGGGIVVPLSDRAPADAGFVLGAPAPNPFGRSATVGLRVDAPQHVRAEVYDVLGRLVTTVFDAPAAAGAPVALSVDGANLAPGTYVLRVTGESFTATRRLTRTAAR